MGRVTPRLYPSNPLLEHCMRVVLVCVERGLAGLREAEEVLMLGRVED